MKLTIFIDGASRGNPGPGAAAAVVTDSSGGVIREEGKFLGRCTNNHAEYSALQLALSLALELGGTELAVFSDSELLVRQFNGLYKIKAPQLKEFMAHLRKQADAFAKISLSHVPREANRRADKIANVILDGEASGGKCRAPDNGGTGPKPAKPVQLLLF